MTRQSLATAATAAAMSMTLTLAAFWPASLAATGKAPAQRPAPEIAAAVLKVNGGELSVRPLKPAYAPGETPQVELRMANPTAAAVKFEAFVTMTAQEPGSPMSRRAPMRKEVWTESVPVSLAPGETRLVTLDTHTKLQAGYHMSFQLKHDKQVLNAGAARVLPAPGVQAQAPVQAADQGE